jgi:hypothetical protein
MKTSLELKSPWKEHNPAKLKVTELVNAKYTTYDTDVARGAPYIVFLCLGGIDFDVGK